METPEIVEIEYDELEVLKDKAKRWDNFVKNRGSHLNNISKEELSERARKAVQARWAKKRAEENKD